MEKKKRKWSLQSLVLKWQNIQPKKYEEELTLHFEKDELFDHHVILPHSEVNPLVYKSVDRFVDRYGGERLTLNIYSGAISKSAEQFFRESFVSHYEDEFRRCTTNLYQCYLRAFILVLVSVLSYYAGLRLKTRMASLPFLSTAIANISLFCIWEIYHTYFKQKDFQGDRKKVQRAKDAEICFHCYSGSRKSAKK